VSKVVSPPRRVEPRFYWTLTAIFAVVFVASGLAPLDRTTWLLENALVLLAGVAIWVLRKRFAPSRRAATLLFVFMCLHELGAHYTYSKVPYDAWLDSLTGHTLKDLLGFKRNHYDRLVHFGGGLLLAPLLRELLLRFSRLSDWGARLAAVSVVMSASLVYELIEWAAASLFGEGVGAAYLGTQGDTWDAQKDMALATLGGILAMLALGSRRATPNDAEHPSSGR